MEFNKVNWYECLNALNFTESENSFGGMQIYDERGVPKWQYETKREQKQLFIFLSGVLYMKNHIMYG